MPCNKKRTKSLSLGFVIRSSINKFLYINESYSMSKRLEDSRGYSYKMQLCEMYFYPANPPHGTFLLLLPIDTSILSVRFG